MQCTLTSILHLGSKVFVAWTSEVAFHDYLSLIKSIITWKVNTASSTWRILEFANEGIHCICWLGVRSLPDERSLGGQLASTSFLFSSLKGSRNGPFFVCVCI